MAILRITESQMEKIELFESKSKELSNYMKEINIIFKDEIINLKQNDLLHLYFGVLDDEDMVDEKTQSICSFLIRSINKKTLKCEFIGSKGEYNPFILKDIIYISKKGNINPIKKLITVTKKYDDSFKRITLNNFLGYSTTQDLSDVQINSSVLKSVISHEFDKLNNQWGKYVEKINNLQKYDISSWEPGLLGMDNIFFHPYGTSAMDDILSKYGIDDKSLDNEDNENNIKEFNKIKFRVIGKEISLSNVSLKEKGEYVGTIKNDTNEILVKYKDINIILKVDEDEMVVKGGSYDVISNIKYLDIKSGSEKEETFKSRIKVISLK